MNSKKLNTLSIEQLMQEALSLPEDLKLQLINSLLASLEGTVDAPTQSEWMAEAQKRRDELMASSVPTIPGDQALAQIRELL